MEIEVNACIKVRFESNAIKRANLKTLLFINTSLILNFKNAN